MQMFFACRYEHDLGVGRLALYPLKDSVNVALLFSFGINEIMEAIRVRLWT